MKKIVCTAAVCAAFAAFAAEDPAREAAIEKGAKFLLSKQAADGHWSDAQMPALTALPLWALTGAKAEGKEVDEARRKAAGFVLATQRPDGGFYVPKPGQIGRASCRERV